MAKGKKVIITQDAVDKMMDLLEHNTKSAQWWKDISIIVDNENSTLIAKLEMIAVQCNRGWLSCENGDQPTLEEFMRGLDVILSNTPKVLHTEQNVAHFDQSLPPNSGLHNKLCCHVYFDGRHPRDVKIIVIADEKKT
jgi:hypothetical protein